MSRQPTAVAEEAVLTPLFVCAADRDMLKLTQQEFTGLPQQLHLELLASVVLCLTGEAAERGISALLTGVASHLCGSCSCAQSVEVPGERLISARGCGCAAGVTQAPTNSFYTPLLLLSCLHRRLHGCRQHEAHCAQQRCPVSTPLAARPAWQIRWGRYGPRLTACMLLVVRGQGPGLLASPQQECYLCCISQRHLGQQLRPLPALTNSTNTACTSLSPGNLSAHVTSFPLTAHNVCCCM